MRYTLRFATALMAVLLFVTMTPAVASAQDSSADPLDDGDIRRAVERELILDGNIPAHRVEVSVDEGIVTLDGTIEHLLAADRALHLAEQVKGVRAVIADLDVMQADRSDAAIRRDVERAMLLDPAADSYEVDVAVNDGEVTLTGTVESFAELRLAEKEARSVRGVTDVDNLIAVVPKAERPDTEIAHEVERLLDWSVNVDDALVNVTVNKGVVHLSGVVGSAAEKSRAAAIAAVTGVTKVVTDDLEVRSWAADEELRGDKYRPRDESAILHSVRDALERNLLVDDDNILIHVDDDAVTLSGSVHSLTALREAAETARHTVGVHRVWNHLTVAPLENWDDGTIAVNVRDAIARDPWLEHTEIMVAVDDGVVRLDGMVDSDFERTHADRIAGQVPGVISVVDRLDVMDRPLAPVWSWDDGTRDWNEVSDDAIRESVRDQLFWSPFVDLDEVQVTVDEGVVHLTGTVDTRSEMRAAVENAWEGGAVDVDAELTVADEYGG